MRPLRPSSCAWPRLLPVQDPTEGPAARRAGKGARRPGSGTYCGSSCRSGPCLGSSARRGHPRSHVPGRVAGMDAEPSQRMRRRRRPRSRQEPQAGGVLGRWAGGLPRPAAAALRGARPRPAPRPVRPRPIAARRRRRLCLGRAHGPMGLRGDAGGARLGQWAGRAAPRPCGAERARAWG